jgi:hypothetical protein
MPDPTPEHYKEAGGFIDWETGNTVEATARALAERDRRLAAEKMAVKNLRRQVAERDARIAELEVERVALCKMIRGGPQDAYSYWNDDDIVGEALDT